MEPQSIRLVDATVGPSNFCSTAVLEPSQNLISSGLMAIPSFLDIQSGRVQLPVLNCTDEVVTLSPRTVLGEAVFAEPHVEVDFVGATVGAVQAEETSVKSADRVDLSLFKFLDDLPPERRVSIEKLIRENADAFAWSELDLGFTDMVKHRIILDTDVPISQPSRRIPPQVLSDVKEHLEQLLAKEIIRPSSSPYASPIVVVRKKNGEIRLCCDFRPINLRTRRDSFPLPRIEESLDALGGATVFSTLDLASGYHQVAMEEDDIPKTAFTCPFGLFEWLRMPFGLCNAPSTFQRLMQKAMSGFLFEILLVYIDDLLVYSKDWDTHLEDLQKVLTRLKEIGVKLKPSKCQMGQPEVAFLGHRVSAEGIATDPDKLRDVEAFPPPKTLKNVRQFLGLTGYYRRFVKDYARIAKPLHELIPKVHKEHPNDPHKGEKHQLKTLWTDECLQAFRELKNCLLTPPVLRYADYTRVFHLHIDAANTGLGAILCQKDDEGKEHPIAYASRKVRPAEMQPNYSSFKIELLAMRWAICYKFRCYLLGSTFIVYTDNNALHHLNSVKMGAVEQRWVAEMGCFNFTTVFKAGKHNLDADALSRNPVGPPVPEDEDITAVTAVRIVTPVEAVLPEGIEALTADSLGALQSTDPDIEPVRQAIIKQKLPPKDERQQLSLMAKSLLRQHKKLKMEGPVLQRLQADAAGGIQAVPVLPTSQRPTALKLAHEQHGHQGAARTLAVLRSRAFWPHMADDVDSACAACQRCQVAKKPALPVRQPPGHLVAISPLEVVAIDFLKMDVSKTGMEHILVMTDVFSKWAMAIATKDETADTVVKVLFKHWILNYGPPLRIHSDRGKCFDAAVLTQLCEAYSIRQSRTTAYHPAGNGQCERFNRTIINLIRTLPPDKKSQWPAHLRDLCMLYNMTPHSVTGMSPYEILFGRSPRLPLDIYLGVSSSNSSEAGDMIRQHQTRLSNLRQHVKDLTAFRHEQRDHLESLRPHRGTQLAIGDHVLVRDHPAGRVKTRDQYRPTPGIVKNIPGPYGGYFSVDFGDGKPQPFTGSELKRITPEEDVNADSPEQGTHVTETVDEHTETVPKQTVDEQTVPERTVDDTTISDQTGGHETVEEPAIENETADNVVKNSSSSSERPKRVTKPPLKLTDYIVNAIDILSFK